MPPEIDLNTWPVWLAVTVVVIKLFQAEIGTLFGVILPQGVIDFFRHRAAREADREEHSQELEEVELNARLQDSAAASLRKSWREENLMALVQAKDEWEREVLSAEIRNQTRELTALHRQVIRTNDLLTAMNIQITRTNDILKNGNGRKLD